MKLSQLVAYLNLLEDREPINAELVCQTQLADWLRKARDAEPKMVHHIEALEKCYDDVHRSLTGFSQGLDSIRQELNSLIAGMQPQYFADSYKLYYRSVSVSDEYLLDRELAMSQSVEHYIASRIMLHSDWHHAGMVIHPRRGKWLPLMVGCDPLYLLDLRTSLLEPCLEQFPIEYRRRVRTYVLREYKPEEDRMLIGTPDGQFGFVLAMDFFQYRPFELIRMYLADIYAKLKPGGVLALTFNDCDRAPGVDLVERNYMCYTPGTMVVSLAKSLGFDVDQFYRLDSANTWLELRRPGELTSVRGGQALAKIVANH